MKSYVFITTEGYTFQPESQSVEPDIENCQVIGLVQGIDANQAFENSIRENDYLLETSFDELICYELSEPDFRRGYFYLNDLKRNLI
jgi:hypothetical protein